MGVQQQDNSPNLSITNCTFRDIYNSGITNIGYGGNTNQNIIGNSLVNINMIPGAWGSLDGTNLAIAMYNPTSGDSIRNNSIDSTGYSGIFEVGQNYKVRNNFINHFCYWNSDGGGIYTGRNGAGRFILGNIVINGMTPQAMGIYGDENTSGVTIQDNSTAACVLGIYLHNGHDCTVRGNTTFQSSSASLNMTHDAGQDLIRNVTVRKNIFVQTATTTQANVSYQDQPEATAITDFGTSDSNNISRPVSVLGQDDNAWFTVKAGPVFTHYTLSQWQSASGYDLHSTRSPRQVPIDSVRFVYNASANTVIQSLGAQYIQILAPPNTTTQWNGNITLAPYTSAVLLLTGTSVPPLTATATVAMNPVLCNGSTTSITLSASGGTSPYQYKIGSGSFGSSKVFTGLGAGTYAFQVRDSAATIFSINVTITQPAQITISEKHGTILVNGGSTSDTVTASGGTGAKQYKLDNGVYGASNIFTGVAAGPHTITVIDANLCTNTLNFTITQPTALVISATATSNPTRCFGGTDTINVSASGATSPYQYSDNAGSTFQTSSQFRGVLAGTYTIVVKDAAGALATTTLTITQPSQITISQSSTAILVNGGTSTTTVTASGGTGTLNYSINGTTFQSSNVFTGVTAGAHTITVRDANLCTNTLNYTLTQPSSLNVSAAATTNPLTCFSNTTTITVTATGGTTPYQYSINGGSFQSSNLFTNRGAGTYSLTVRDTTNVTKTTTLVITQPTQITITESHTTITINGGTSTITVTASGGTGSKTYSIDGTTFQSSNVFSGVIAGTYTITVKDANLCTNTLTTTITQPSTVLTVTTTLTTPILCNGGTGLVTVTPSGGTPPYQYRALPTYTTYILNRDTFSVRNGTWTFYVKDAAGSIVSVARVVSQPAAITISIGVVGGIVTVTATGGVGSKQYKLDAGVYQSSNIFTGVSAGNHTITVKDGNGCTSSKAFSGAVPIYFIATVGTILCNGGTTTVGINATGGTSPYTGTGTYTRAAGTWTFTVNDATGARADTTITISQPSPMNVTVSFGTIVTNGGTTTVTVTATGGTGTKQYSLDGGTYQLSNSFVTGAGNHTITVKDANNCLVQTSFSITEPTDLTIAVVVGTAISCNGGTTTVTVSGSGGTGTFSNITGGTYTFSVKDAFSAQHDTIVTISQPAALTLSIATGTITINGNTTTVTATGGGGTGGLTYSLDGGAYQGSSSFSGVSAGLHTVTVKDGNSCTKVNSFSISQPTELVITISRGAAITCYGGTQTITVGSTGGTTPITGTGSFAKLAGTYTFTVTDAFGAVADTIITVTQPTQITISVTTGTIIVNGGTTTVTATASGGTSTLTYDLDGGGYQGTGAFSGVAAGQHIVTVKDANNCTNTNSFSISQPGALFITATPTLSSLACYGDVTTVTVSGTGGTTPLTYGKNGAFQSSGTFNNVAAGTYTFSVKDAFSIQHDTILTITQAPLISLIQITQYPNPISVYGGTADSVIVQNAGGTPINDSVYQYKLDGGSFNQSDSAFKYKFTGVTGGNHTVTIKDANGCTQTYSFTVVQPVYHKPRRKTNTVYSQL